MIELPLLVKCKICNGKKKIITENGDIKKCTNCAGFGSVMIEPDNITKWQVAE